MWGLPGMARRWREDAFEVRFRLGLLWVTVGCSLTIAQMVLNADVNWGSSHRVCSTGTPGGQHRSSKWVDAPEVVLRCEQCAQRIKRDEEKDECKVSTPALVSSLAGEIGE